MNAPKLIHTQKLLNGLIVSVYDQTTVYFGDYHHVRLQIVCSLDANSKELALCCPADIEPGSPLYRRTLEKMGVPSDGVDIVINALLNDFHQNALPYISSQEFPLKMIQKERADNKRPVRKYTGNGNYSAL